MAPILYYCILMQFVAGYMSSWLLQYFHKDCGKASSHGLDLMVYMSFFVSVVCRRVPSS